jgi:DNA-binding transcriptional MerR regulator
VPRFWETRFSQIRPMKRGGGRRYYRPDDVDLLRGIRHLLYGEGYTIRGVQRILREPGPRFVQAVWREGAPQPPVGRGAGEPPEGERGRFGLWPAMGAAEEAGDADDEAPESDDQVPHVRLGAPAKSAQPAGLGAEDTKRLRATLDRLIDCKSLLEAALARPV